LWKFKVVEDDIVGVEAINSNLMITVASLDSRNMPLCETCLMKELCIGQCLGSMFEANGDPFMPIPTVCALEHAKILGILDGVWDIGEMGSFYDVIARKKKDSIRLIEGMRGPYGL
jgi:radical SAM protein with 4Fe4S-binding SPASM domain